MQEKAWSTGGLKKFINKNVYGQYISEIPDIIDNGVSVNYSSKEKEIISEVYLINHTKKIVIAAIINKFSNDDASRVSIYTLNYDFLINLNIINKLSNITSSGDIITLDINTEYIVIELNKTLMPYNEGDKIEMMYQTTKYGYIAQI